MKYAGLIFTVCILMTAPAAFSQVDEEVNVGIIEIWTKVTDGKNQIVQDLKPEDFSVFIDGKKMDLRCFDKTFDAAQDPAAASQQQEEQETPAYAEASSAREKRTFIFFFDLLHSSTRDIDFLRSRITEFLRKSFRDDDQGIIFALLPSVSLGVVQKMTSNREALLSVVNRMGGNPTLTKRVRNNEKELLNVLYAFNTSAGGSQETGDNPGSGARSPETITQARGLARTFAAQEKNLSKLTLNSFLSIAEYLNTSPYEGRPVMIYVSGGFSLRPGQNYYQMVQQAIEATYVRGTEEMAYWEYPPDNDFENEVKRAIGLLNRLNITIYSIDANGLEGYDRDVDLTGQQASLGGANDLDYAEELQDSLAMVSRETGGMAFLNSQNFMKGLEDITNDMGQQYWLCANLPSSKKRGTYHKIEVKVARADVDVRHRKGYVD